MKYGYFNDKKMEYIITNPDTPTPWLNYLGVNDYCAMISGNGGGYSFYKSPKLGRITRYRYNNLPADRPGRYLYIKEKDSKDFWSLSWQPVGKDLKNFKTETHHGLGYTEIISEYKKILSDVIYYVPIGKSYEVWLIKLKSLSDEEMKLKIYSYIEFAFWDAMIDLIDYQYSLNTARVTLENDIISYRMLKASGEWKEAYSFITLPIKGWVGERSFFIGSHNDESNPEYITKNKQSNKKLYIGGNPIASFETELKLKPGESKTFVVVVGVGSAKRNGSVIKKKYRNINNADKDLNELKTYWEKIRENFKIESKDKMVNSWLNVLNPYQAHTTFNWSRSASYYETGTFRDGLGFRDSCQDILGVVHSIPERVRLRILDLASAIYSKGNACHTFQPLTGTGTGGDDYSDDHLWLIVAVYEYIAETGDFKILDEKIKYFDKGNGGLYEHLQKIINYSLSRMGKHNLSLGLRADWNDCLNLQGGESVWTTELLYFAMRLMVDISELKKDKQFLIKLKASMKKIRDTINRVAWDGEWYIRGFTSKGNKIGSKECKEGKIYLLSNAWAIISGIATDEYAKKCMDSVNRHLATDYGLKLLAPPYTKFDEYLGSITAYPPGMKENGSIFVHSNNWGIMAEAVLGNGERAWRYFRNIIPLKFNDNAEIRKSEPYVFAQFTASNDSPNEGESKNSWLTGTASWAYYVATRYLLGIKPVFNGIIVEPVLDKKIDNLVVYRKFRGAKYRFVFKSKVKHYLEVDGKKFDDEVIPIFKDNKVHTVEIY